MTKLIGCSSCNTTIFNLNTDIITELFDLNHFDSQTDLLQLNEQKRFYRTIKLADVFEKYENMFDDNQVKIILNNHGFTKKEFAHLLIPCFNLIMTCKRFYNAKEKIENYIVFQLKSLKIVPVGMIFDFLSQFNQILFYDLYWIFFNRIFHHQKSIKCTCSTIYNE